MFQPRQHHILTRLLHLSSQEHLIQNRINLIKIKDQIQLADIPKKRIEDFNKEVDGFEVSELVIVGVDADAEEKPGIAAVDDFVVAELGL